MNLNWNSIISDAGRRLAQLAGTQLTQDLSARMGGEAAPQIAASRAPAGSRGQSNRTRRSRNANLNAWVADSNARRVPTFVIEATGLDTKKALVARYGAGIRFEKGKALPKPLAASKGARAGQQRTQKQGRPAQAQARRQGKGASGGGRTSGATMQAAPSVH